MEHPPTDPELPSTPESEPAPEPRIYAASLSDYNAGRLYGAWLPADADPDDLATAIATMLAHSPTPDAEEWAIHDYEGFGPLRLSEYEDLSTVSQIGLGIVEHGPAFAHWAAICETGEQEELARFDDVYLGHWVSVEAYAAELLDDLGLDDLIERAVPEYLQPYVKVDTEGFARDLEYSGDLTASEGDNGVYLFDQLR